MLKEDLFHYLDNCEQRTNHTYTLLIIFADISGKLAATDMLRGEFAGFDKLQVSYLCVPSKRWRPDVTLTVVYTSRFASLSKRYQKLYVISKMQTTMSELPELQLSIT